MSRPPQTPLSVMFLLCFVVGCQSSSLPSNTTKPETKPESLDKPEPQRTLPLGRGKHTKVVLLGTGTPVPDPERSGPCVAVVVGDHPYLVDLGPGLVRRAEAARLQGIDALRVEHLNRAFVTHLHSDHTLGFPDLIFSPWVVGRDEPLHVHGPPGIAKMAEHLTQAWSEDVHVRVHGFESANTKGSHVKVHEIAADAPAIIPVFKDERVNVTAFRVPHGSWKHAYGYKFETSDRTIVISGDTGPSKAIVDACQGCDVLVHEVYSAKAFAKLPPGGQRYHGTFHTSTVELARLAAEAKPKLLVLYHQLFWGKSDQDLVDEVREHYDGAVVSGQDLGEY